MNRVSVSARDGNRYADFSIMMCGMLPAFVEVAIFQDEDDLSKIFVDEDVLYDENAYLAYDLYMSNNLTELVSFAWNYFETTYDCI